MTTRLRRTFKYPSDQDTHDALDDQQQEHLISTLQSQTTSTDTLYIQIFTAIPLVCLPAFLYFFVRGSSSPGVRFVCVLGITSLLASSLAMYLTPVGEDGRVSASAGVIVLPGVGELDSDGPLGRVVPVLNPVVCGLLGVASWGMRRRDGLHGVPEGFWLFCLVPGLVAGVGWFVRRSMREVQGGIGELKELRYGLKGA